MSDLISREAILKNIEKIRQGVQMMDDTRRASIVMNGMYLCENAVRNQPTAQPQLIEEPEPYEVENDMVTRMTNCPNCGAPITRHQCEYCGTVFW